MEIYSHWRTRTIGEAQEQGYTAPPGDLPRMQTYCRCAVAVVAGSEGHANRETFLGNIPLRCQRCGNAAPIIGVRQNNTA